MEIQWSLVLFTAVAGAGAWLFAFIGINTFLGKTKNDKGIMVGCVIAAILLALGGVFSMTHLSHIDHVLWVLQHPAPGIFVEALLIGVDAVLAIVYFLLVKRGVSGIAMRVIAVLAIVMGPVFTYSCGSSYMMSSQLSWNTLALPFGYLGTAIPSGAALWALLNWKFKEDEAAVEVVGWELFAGGLVALVLSSAYAFISGAATGDQAPLFWIVVFTIGSAMPAACGFYLTRRPARVLALGVAGVVCGFAGSIGYRALMWTASAALMALFGVTI
jgi:DMSO reductase anchor subunit